MEIPTARKREFDTKEVTFIQEAIGASGLDPASIDLVWESSSVNINRVVEVHPVLFDCRGLLNTPCWLVSRLSASEGPQACSCGELVREAATGTYGSLKTAIAAALAEVVRLRVLTNITDHSQPILKERPADQPAPCSNDFITQCVRIR
jgi:hypothetical protein